MMYASIHTTSHQLSALLIARCTVHFKYLVHSVLAMLVHLAVSGVIYCYKTIHAGIRCNHYWSVQMIVVQHLCGYQAILYPLERLPKTTWCLLSVGSSNTNFAPWSAFQRELTILTTTIIILVVHNYKCCITIPENILLSVSCII